MGDLMRQTGVSRATIYHYLELGLLPEPHRPNKRMAYYAPLCVERVKLIRHLQSRRFMPLSQIKSLIDSGSLQGLGGVDVRLARGLAGELSPRAEVLERYPLSDEVMADLAGAGLVRAGGDLSRDEVAIVASVHAMRLAGLDEKLGFSIEQLGVYAQHLGQLIDAEIAMFNPRVLGAVSTDELEQLATAAIEGSSEILAALHRKMLRDRLEGRASTEP